MMKYLWVIVICCLISIDVSQCQSANLSFPENFLIGAATASHQIEGAWNVSGQYTHTLLSCLGQGDEYLASYFVMQILTDKGENVWDYFTHNKPELITDRSNADIACNSYYKYQEDVEWIRSLGLDFYRFSLSWSRILPNGFADQVSEDGIQYYKNLTQELLNYNITPFVTLYHWDHPQILEEMGGWTNEMMVEWYADYARVVFTELGPLVKNFITINEPHVYCGEGYNDTRKAPGKILENMGHYICVHNTLKAHATAWRIYDEEFRSTQQGQIGIDTNCAGFVSGENTSNATFEQYFLFNCGWIMHPIYIGDYPVIMKSRIAMISELEGYPFSRLPEFSAEWIEYIKGTSDFFGLNHYTSVMPTFDPDEDSGIYTIDSGIIGVRNSSWEVAASIWLHVVPEGFGNLLRMIRDQYDNPPLYVFENGYSDTGELQDYNRINYFHQYLTELLKAVQEDGCDVRGYTIWSLLDNFEWQDGYTEKFGIVQVDFDSDDRTRTAKLSTSWWQEVLRTRTLQDVPTNNS